LELPLPAGPARAAPLPIGGRAEPNQARRIVFCGPVTPCGERFATPDTLDGGRCAPNELFEAKEWLPASEVRGSPPLAKFAGPCELRDAKRDGLQGGRFESYEALPRFVVLAEVQEPADGGRFPLNDEENDARMGELDRAKELPPEKLPARGRELFAKYDP
jgi:hypothetical protein